jgi:hypothetical protein
LMPMQGSLSIERCVNWLRLVGPASTDRCRVRGAPFHGGNTGSIPPGMPSPADSPRKSASIKRPIGRGVACFR